VELGPFEKITYLPLDPLPGSGEPAQMAYLTEEMAKLKKKLKKSKKRSKKRAHYSPDSDSDSD